MNIHWIAFCLWMSMTVIGWWLSMDYDHEFNSNGSLTTIEMH
jgi:hypothetical protein